MGRTDQTKTPPKHNSSRKIVITGGGTGGHVFPALAIAEELRSRGDQVLYVGTSHGMEAKLVPPRGFEFFTVRSGAVKNQGMLKRLKTLGQLAGGILWSLGFLRREKPSAVIGVGGYVSVPICFAAWLSRRPLYLQEQNVSVGIANRFLGRLSKRVFLGFEQAKESFDSTKCLVSGNPIRRDFLRSDFPAYDPKGHWLVVMGGSQGARAINEAMISYLSEMSRLFPELRILHQTGKSDFEKVRGAYQASFKPGHFEVSPFIEDMASAYARATLVVCRSGALTVSELIQVRRPAIFVPYPRQGQNDQTANASYLESAGAARVVEQGGGFEKRLWSTFVGTFKPEILAQMERAFFALRQGNALATIADTIHADLR